MRYWRSSIAVFALALLASLCVHLPIYEALGVLAEVLLAEPPADAKPGYVEFEMAPLAEPEVKRDPEHSGDVIPEVDKPSDEAVAVDVPKAKPKVRRRPQPKEKTPKEEPEPVLVKPEKQPPPPPELEQNRLAVTQKSEDPDVEPPPDARFTAEENRRVEEETVARVRNMHRDDAQPDPGRPNKAEEPEPGNDDEQEVADLQNVDGSDERTPDEAEAKHDPKVAHLESAGQREDRAVTRAPAVAAAARERDATQASGAQSGGVEETIIVNDGSGSFAIRRSPEGKGQRNEGGDYAPGRLSPHRVTRRGSEAQAGIDLSLSWSQFESTFGNEELRAQRQAYLEQRKSRARGSNRTRQWRKFRAAIENFVPNVRPGNQTALNAAASPFAHYLATIHRRIHREYAHKFLRGLPIAGGPYSDRTLHTKLEIVINGDGSLHKVGVAKTSGFLPFDYGAFNAVTRAAPFSPPPRRILSGDGRVYVHWGFYRNERQCGTFNASPFILPNPPGTPKPGNGPLRDLGPGTGDTDGELGERESPEPSHRHAHAH